MSGNMPVATTPQVFPRRWAIVGLLFTASLINYFDRATISFALPLISKELHLGPESKGLLLSSFFWSYTLMQIPMGMLADRLNLRWLYAGAFTLWSVAQGLIGISSGLTSLIALRILLGVGESVYLPGGSKIVSLLFPPAQRALPIGLFDAGTRTGLVVEGVLVPWMLTTFGWRASFSVVGFSALVWLIPWLLVTPSQLRAPARSSSAIPPVSVIQSVTALLTNRNLLGICLGFFCFDYYWYFLVNWLPDYLVTARGLTMLRAGIYAALPYLVFGMSEPIGGWIADRLIVDGWNETRVRKGIVTFAFLTGLLLIPAARVSSACRRCCPHHRGVPCRSCDGEHARHPAELRPEPADWSVDRDLQLRREHCRHPLANYYRRADRQDRIVHAAIRAGGVADRERPARFLAHRARRADRAAPRFTRCVKGRPSAVPRAAKRKERPCAPRPCGRQVSVLIGDRPSAWTDLAASNFHVPIVLSPAAEATADTISRASTTVKLLRISHIAQPTT